MTALSTRQIDPVTVTTGELEAIDDIIQRAYRMPSRIERIKRFLLVQGGVWAVAEADGVLVSVGAAMAYPDGRFGWIGLIGTDPAMSGKGGGRAVTQFLIDDLAAQGCRSALDASEAGAPLYRTMNFADHGRVTKLYAPTGSWSSSKSSDSLPSFTAPTNDRFTKVATEFTVHQFRDSNLPEVVQYDTVIFGANRSALLRYLVEHAVDRCFVARSRIGGSIVGYLVAQSDCIGPVCADNAPVADALLHVALSCSWDRAPEIILPNAKGHLERFIAAGWTIDRTLYHQRLDFEQLPGDRKRLVAQVSFGEG
jgi:GNAT superfamily N-acetyltransferase